MKYFQKILKAIVSFASKDETRHNLCSVAITEDGRTVTTDGHTMCVFTPYDSNAGPVRSDMSEPKTRDRVVELGPIKAALTGTKAKTVVTVGTEEVQAEGGAAVPFAPSSGYPNWRQVLRQESDSDAIVRINPHYLKRVAEAAIALEDLSAKRGAAATCGVVLRVSTENRGDEGESLDPVSFAAEGEEGELHMIVMPMRM